MANKRTFLLQVNEGLLPLTKQKMRGYNGFQLSNGMWFNTRARVEGSQIVQIEYMRNFNKYINDIITSEARRLQQFWNQNVNKYFNRRAFGMFYYNVGNTHRLNIHKKFNRKGQFLRYKQQYGRREHTGQLKRALIIKNQSLEGCELYVRPCYAKSGTPIDYVNVLVQGARPGPNPYIPSLDKRINIPGKYWNGISRNYWATWQSAFEKQVRDANTRMNLRIEQYLLDKGHMEQRDRGRALRVSPLKKDITKVREKVAARPSKTYAGRGKSAYVESKWKDIYKKFTPKT